jgi:hypothetical protein
MSISYNKLSLIHLLLFILLISIIIFVIYLSYGYTSININKNKEGFINLDIDNTVLDINPLYVSNNYAKYYTDVLNMGINKQNDKINDIYYDTINNLKNAEILKKLNNNLAYTESSNNLYPESKPIKTIKSRFNSQYLSTINNDLNKYGIIVNDKCLTVAGLCPGEFCLEKCQDGIYSSNSQKFVTDRIKSNVDASRIMNVDVNYINNNNVYPYNIFRSAINNKCLTISNDGLTVQPCNLNNTKQQWDISPDANICRLD